MVKPEDGIKQVAIWFRVDLTAHNRDEKKLKLSILFLRARTIILQM